MKPLLIALFSVGISVGAPAAKTWESLGRLPVGDPIEVVTMDRAEKGAFISASTESLTIRTSRGEQKFGRPDVMRVVVRAQSHRLRNMLIGAGAGVAVGLIVDQSVGRYFRNESNPDSVRPLIWTLPIAVGAGIGAAIPGYSVIYRK